MKVWLRWFYRDAKLGRGLKDFFDFHPYSRKISNLTNIFQMAWFNHQAEKMEPALSG